MKTGTCRLCTEQKPLVKAHIESRRFGLWAKAECKNLLEVREHDPRKKIEYWQNGIWDDGILCQGCDGGFRDWEDYGFELLSEPAGFDGLPKTNADLQSFVVRGIDFDRFQLFLLSVLWRAAISKEPFYAHVQLGPYEEVIADILRSRKAAGADVFPIIVFRLVQQNAASAVFPPRKVRIEGINYSELYFPHTRILIKIDQQALPHPLASVALKNREDNIFIPTRLGAYEQLMVAKAAEVFRQRFSK